jgi:putative nucleotidyltransferase with HDIG domain
MQEQSNHRRKTIGVLIDWSVDPFQQMFLDGVLDFTAAAGMSCIVFEGGSLNSPYQYELQRNAVFQLAVGKEIDGLVILSASIGLFVGRQGLIPFWEQFRSKPVVSVSMEAGAIPSVLIDNRTGMRELMLHLIDRHGFRRFAFAKGPERNQDSQERWEVCAEVLREREIPIDPRLVYPGDFSIGSGMEAVRFFLDSGAGKIDVIVAFDDGMAIGVLRELAKRNIRVPDQIAITGVNNIDLSPHLTPSLTTVKLPIFTQGWTAAKLIQDLMEGRSVPPKTYLSTKLLVRESCGCVSHSASVLEGVEADARRFTTAGIPPLKEQFPVIHDIFQSHLPPEIHAEDDRTIPSSADGLAGQSGRGNLQATVKLFDGISSRSELENLDYDTFQNMLYDLWRNRTIVSAGGAAAVADEDLLFQSVMKLGHKVVQRQWNRINEFLQERQRLDLVCELLVFSDVPRQMDVLAKRLPDLGIGSCYLSLYRNDPGTDHRNAVCMLGVRDLQRLDSGVEGMVFPSSQLIPDDFLSGEKQRLMIVEPLKDFGFILFEIGPGSSQFSAFLGDIVSSALQGALLFGELEHQRDGLTQNLETMRKAMAGFIQTMAATVEARDPYTAGHQRRVSDLARSIAQEMKLPSAQIEGVRMAGIIHDLGKIYVPAEILNRAGILDDIEMSMIKKHPQVAYDILKNINFPWPIADIVYQHHERLNGSGYPNKLKVDAICLEARILAVADVVEAMSSRRPYREALGVEKALEEIIKHKGILYDPAVVDACVDLVRNKGYKFRATGFFNSSN